ncbi:MAG TPA: hypothetical protein VFJ93_01040 [Gaiellaceae bacterium]|nr:hypothetical protein [Gaiellaceae bacterium]
MAPNTTSPERYAEEMGELWTELSHTLARLDRYASTPDRLDDVRAEVSLGRLRYALHLASEHAYGVAPPPGAETAHAELRSSLAAARDTTAEVAEALTDQGAEAVEPLLPEWRGALFRVRLARLRLATPVARRETLGEQADEGFARPLIAFIIALVGALAFVGGATLGLWPIWAAGALAVCASVVAYRP